MSEVMRDRYGGCLLGLACGDAVGTTVEFQPRGSFAPVTDLIGGGPFDLQPGEWTDDTSMALCLATSLVERQGFDARDQMERYCRWWQEGYLSANGRCFDIGNTVCAALARFLRTGDPWSGATDPRSAGNGSIMRLAPVVLYFHPDFQAVVRWSAESSRTTHGAAECLDACRLFGALLWRALQRSGGEERTRERILFDPWDGSVDPAPLELESPKIRALAQGAYRDRDVAEIRGSGYVVESLEAALWCFLHTDSYGDAILLATNLGDDADTTAAVCGQIAGAFYGESGIPGDWLRRVAMAREIRGLVDHLYRASVV